MGTRAKRSHLLSLDPEAWAMWARKDQAPPEGDWHTWLFLGGRGAGKTRAGAEWLHRQARPRHRLALVGPTLHDVREVMIAGESGLGQIGPVKARPRFESSRRRLVWPNGAVAYAFSAEDTESLRGPQFHAAWADEFCAWKAPAKGLAMLRMGLRLGTRTQMVVTTTPKPLTALKRLMAEPGVVMTRAGTRSNRLGLSAGFAAQMEHLYGGTQLAAQELEGQVVEAAAGALWRAEDLARCRGARPPDLERVVVAVDPPAGSHGDACGIIAAGRADGRAFVLADASVSGASPLGWAGVVADLCATERAEAVVAEANQGGDMVRTVLSLGGCTVPVRLVHARKGKRA
ncbi:MAG: terminase large subunit domain-containing protein, partial [Asticcacaulis sp.]